MRQIDTNIIALDPGKLTGIALLNQKGEFAAKELHFTEVVDAVAETVQLCRITHVPIWVSAEREVISVKMARESRGDTNWPFEVIGCARYLCYKARVNFVLYSASDAKHFAPNDTLKKLGWYTRGGEGHANDAARILAVTLAAADKGYWESLVLRYKLLEDE